MIIYTKEQNKNILQMIEQNVICAPWLIKM